MSHSLETRRKIGDAVRKALVAVMCLTCKVSFFVRPFEAKKRIYCSNECSFRSTQYRDKHRIKSGHFPSGEKHWNWKGGITSENERIRASVEMKAWRFAVLERDDYRCVECGSEEHLEADHIKSFALFPELRFEVSNGRTLCNPCHKKTETYAGKSNIK